MNSKKIMAGEILFLFFLLLCASPLFAQESPFNKDTEIYYQVNFTVPEAENFITDFHQRLRKIELLEPYFKKFEEEYKISLKDDVFSWLGDRLSMGIVGEPDSSVIHNAVKEEMGYSRAKNHLNATIRNMSNINNALDLYQQDKGKLPDTLDALVPDYLYEEIKPARGGKFIYKKLSDTDYQLKNPPDQYKEIGLKGSAPCYTTKDGFSNDYPLTGQGFSLKNIMVCLEVKDSQKARDSFKKISDVITENGGPTFTKKTWDKYVLWVSPTISYTFYRNLVLIGDSPEVLKKGLLSLENPDKNIYKNEVFQSFLKNTPGVNRSQEILFANLKKINLNSQIWDIKHPGAVELVDNLYYAGYFIRRSSADIEGDIIITFDEKKDLPYFKEYFKQQPQYPDVLMNRLPSGLPVAATYNLGELWEILNLVGKDIPDLASGMDSAKQFVSSSLGMELKDEILDSTTGEVAVSYKVRDLILSAFFNFVEEKRSTREEPQPHDSQESNSEPSHFTQFKGKDSGLREFLFSTKGFPVTFFVGVRDKAKLEKLLARLREKSPSQKREYHNDIAVYKGDKMTYCLTEDLLIVHTYPSDIMMKEYLDTLYVKRERLSNNTFYQDFRKGVWGRPIVVQYQDAEWAISLTKGLLLLFLPEFADYAQLLGNYKESWSSLSVTPQGFQIHFKMYQKETAGKK